MISSQIQPDEKYMIDEVRDGFLIPGMMKRLWAKELKTYQVLREVCDEQGIHVSAMWGTLLGAVRHGGYIPWDDDIDVEIKHDEYLKLEKLDRDKTLPDDYWIDDYVFEERENLVRRWMSSRSLVEPYDEWEKNYGFPFVGIIDIFVQDYIPTDFKESKVYWETLREAGRIKEVAKTKKRGSSDISFEKDLKKLERIFDCRFDRWSSKPVFIQILEAMDRYMAGFNAHNCDQIAIPAYYENNNNRIVPKELYAYYIDIDYEYTKMSVPVGYDGILRRYFGDYMVPVLNFGIHGYPAYEGMNRDATKTTGFAISKYVYDERSVGEVLSQVEYMGTPVEELIGLYNLICDMYGEIADITDQETVSEILGQCKQIAVRMSEIASDRTVGYESLIENLEKYCEGELSNFEDAIKSDIDSLKEVKEVVFIIYSSKHWKYVDSLYRVAKSDDEWSVVVIAVPYYLRDYSQNIDKQSMTIEDKGYPDDVVLTTYDGYDFAKRHPDMVVYQYPYDEYGSGMSIHPYYYVSNLRKYTGNLVLLPPFKLREICDSDIQARYTLSTFLQTPGGIYADHIVTQSEQMRETCVSLLAEFLVGSSDNKAEVDELKSNIRSCIVSEGLPVDDYTGEEVVEDTYIYTLGASMLYEYGISAIAKARKVITYISDRLKVMNSTWGEHREDIKEIKLVWYEDPYVRDILQFKEGVYHEYTELVKWFVDGEYGEYVSEVSEDDRIQLANRCIAMYGDGCVLMNECRMQGKRILWETPTCDDIGSIQNKSSEARWSEDMSIVVEGVREGEWTISQFMDDLEDYLQFDTGSKQTDIGSRVWKAITVGNIS